ncbi:oxidation resistance protein 1 isoform X2 [Amphiprion ocellaris]|uniref:oxidation resistance protein 1 isoform X2 n=1 Tax=Amphiprion ocellaris TaxID=80972 RepID=UPI0024115531|nr:oxidation resistance protein 1 isoform X2 [Amphiprion ocellaris]
MAQSVRRPETLGAMDHEPQRDKTRTSYFGNVKTRLGSKLPAGVTQPPQFAKRPWESQPHARAMQDASSQRQHQPIVGRPLNHIPHIRNPKLRQYYLQGTSWDLNNAAVTKEHVGARSDDSTSSRGLPGDTVFSVSSKFNSNGASSAEESRMGHHSSHTSAQPSSSSASLIPRELVVPKGKNASTGQGSSHPEVDSESEPKKKPEAEAEADQDSLDTLAAQPQSLSPEAEYDKLLDVEAVPMPDGQLCLLALPPECCQGEGPEATTYLKLFCRYITDRKGVVSGILLVTSNKIFFDPCKTHPLVKEHGCEEYLLSCSVDNMSSVSFYSDISHVHFNTSHQRRKEKKIFQKLKAAKSQAGGLPNHKGESSPALVCVAPSDLSSLALSLTKEVSEDDEPESTDMAEVEKELDSSPLEVLSEASVGGLGVAVLSSAATFCCGGQEAASKVTINLLHSDETDKSSVKSQTAVSRRSSVGSPGSLMFVRLRVQPSAAKKKGIGGLGSARTLPRRDAWIALSQESADELCAYLKHCRPDLCILEGREEEDREADRDEEEFVLIEDREEEEEEDEEEMSQKHRSSGDDWEMVLMEESRDKPTLIIDRDPEGLSNILESSHILEASHVRELCKELPPRTVGHTWQLAYSTSRHGASLKSLYRKLSATDSPVLIVIKDALDEVFGAFLSHALRPSETFYGTGETFLFMLHPRFKCFRWTGENSFFIKGDLDCFAVGGGSGHFGLWVDENLYLGRSSPCYTFNNCCLSETDDFRVMELEVWTFG